MRHLALTFHLDLPSEEVYQKLIEWLLANRVAFYDHSRTTTLEEIEAERGLK